MRSCWEHRWVQPLWRAASTTTWNAQSLWVSSSMGRNLSHGRTYRDTQYYLSKNLGKMMNYGTHIHTMEYHEAILKDSSKSLWERRQDRQHVVNENKAEWHVHLNLPKWVSKWGNWPFWEIGHFIFPCLYFDDVLISHKVTLLDWMSRVAYNLKVQLFCLAFIAHPNFSGFPNMRILF